MNLAHIPTERLREVAEAFRRIEHVSEPSAIAAACIEAIIEGRGWAERERWEREHGPDEHE